MTIFAANSVSGFFEEVVDDAIKARHVETTGGARSYLVALLADFAHPGARTGETMSRPLAFLLDEALHTATPAERFEKLRTLGDGVLYASGFFGDHFEKRGVEQRYLVGIGTTAYGAAGSMLRLKTEEERAPHDVFGELAAKFGMFVDVLADVADSTIAMGAQSPKNILRVYERWLKTGSDRLAETLTTHGLVPQRSSKGVH